MPSFLKKLLLGKDLSNPYINQYHPGHRATPQPIQHVANSAAQAIKSHPTGLNLSTRIPPCPVSRPVSPTYLEEARRIAGRDPITGHALSPEQYPAYDPASAQTASQSACGRQQPYTNEQMRYNPYVTSGHAAVGGDWSSVVQERAEQDRRTATTDVQRERHDVAVAEERMRRAKEERVQADVWRERDVGGYFAPERSVREYYGGP
ncbi:uncharacterized protein M421DRAFT_92779 [Didymella exigua CBS 183.55]|uniref:Uncharacterized protein n=1 Tax=Didymella exigua CBS 183.55 TaxID=1150837 RepID=A0A6A5RHX4_9PLEO|nr:uncharacterized protein M421DRAFT_92779 [Didymella exigua CBS 183.55]KAF1927931.1 hypothetical protein M421DRAFT_92779 [Didymella exigua CBS 183.55]